ncbi:hypothetical protein LCGC14_3041830 [marine sediment metagenome]|uniref:Uncharacterized protein n=1 Tax=marine sediment metagenome TaxID=412755 RepID=A0A0F8XCK6_9ZZZZ
MKSICAQRKGSHYIAFAEEDRLAGLVFPENQFLRLKISGSKKERSYRELSCYFSSCQYIADQATSTNMDSKTKVHYLTRIQLGFVEDTVFDPNTGLLHWIPRSLSYSNCDQPDAHKFIADALEEHAFLAGVGDVDEYVKMLNTL